MTEESTPHRRPRRTAIGGALLGALLVLASLLAFTGLATAQDSEPSLAPAAEADVDVDGEAATDELDEGIDDELDDLDDLDEFDEGFWDDEALFDDADFAACLDENLGIGEDADEQAWETIGEDRWAAAEEACEEYLPEEIVELEAAFEEFEACLAEQGIDFDEEIEALGEGPVVFVEGEDSETMAAFGDGDGSVTVTKTGDDVVVVTTGDVEQVELDFEAMDEEFEAAHEACEELLPEEVFFADEFDFEDDDIEGVEPGDEDL